MQLHVRPRAQLITVAEPHRLSGALRVDRDGLEHVGHFAFGEATPERDRAEVVTVQPAGELAQHRVLGVRRHAFDHQLMARHAERHARSLLEQQARPAGHGGGGGRERRVALGVHGMFVEGDGQLDQEVRQITRQGRAFTGGRRHDAKDTRTGSD